MSNNPFETGNDAPANPWSESESNGTQASAPAVPADVKYPFSIKLTLKANESYNAEWINPYVSGRTADEAAKNAVEMLNALTRHGVIDSTAAAAQYTREQYKGERQATRNGNRNNGNRNSGNRGGGGQRQQNATPPPGAERPTCAHGPMEFKSGISKKGNAYKVWSCPSNDQHDQCAGIFVN